MKGRALLFLMKKILKPIGVIGLIVLFLSFPSIENAIHDWRDALDQSAIEN